MDNWVGQWIGKWVKEDMKPKKNYFTIFGTTSCFVMKTLQVKSSAYAI